MHCTNCGTALRAEARFCPNCGTDQTAAAAPAARMPEPFAAGAALPAYAVARPSGNGLKIALWSALAILVVAGIGGAGYWGWSNHVAAQEAARKVSELEKTAAMLQQQQAQSAKVAEVASANAAEEAERSSVAAAQLALDKHIAEEEAQARNQRR